MSSIELNGVERGGPGPASPGQALPPPELRTLRLSFRLGEWTLGAWRPRLLVLDPEDYGRADWPPPAEALQAVLAPEAHGLLCRKADAGRFAPGIGRQGALLQYVISREVLHYVRVEGAFDAYLKGFSPKSRQNVSRSVRRFLEAGSGANRCELYTEPQRMREFHEQAVAISRQTYQTRLLDAGIDDSPEFLAQLERLAQRGDARGYLLMEGDKAIAFAWCRRAGSRLVYDTIGYLPESAGQSPGTVLLYLILKDVFAEGTLRIVDFGPGEAMYKSLFGTHQEEFVDLYLLRPTLRHRLLLALHWRLGNLSSTIGAVLERFGLKARVRKWVRGLRG